MVPAVCRLSFHSDSVTLIFRDRRFFVDMGTLGTLGTLFAPLRNHTVLPRHLL